MKIIRENAVYVQKSDLIEIYRIGVGMPLGLIQKGCKYTKFEPDADTRLEFIKFTEQEEIEFLKKFRWIPDYDELVEMDRDELYEKAKKILEIKKALVDKYDLWDETTLKQYELLNLEFECIRNFVWNHRKDIKFTYPLPKEVKRNYKHKKQLI